MVDEMTDEEMHEALDRRVGEWHRGVGEGVCLREYLGMTEAEYGEFALRATIPAGYVLPVMPRLDSTPRRFPV